MKAFILLAMIFFHILDDFGLQATILVNMKQKSWWMDNYPEYMPLTGNGKCKNDYIVALIMHAFSWSFMIHLPIAFYYGFHVNDIFLVSMVANTMLHAIIDNTKANEKRINLVEDQCAHMFQITLAYICTVI